MYYNYGECSETLKIFVGRWVDHKSRFQGEVANLRRGNQIVWKSNGLCILQACVEFDLLYSHRLDCSLVDGKREMKLWGLKRSRVWGLLTSWAWVWVPPSSLWGGGGCDGRSWGIIALALGHAQLTIWLGGRHNTTRASSCHLSTRTWWPSCMRASFINRGSHPTTASTWLRQRLQLSHVDVDGFLQGPQN